MKINTNYLNLVDNYLFSTVAKKERDFREANPDKTVYKLSIGDVTLPLSKAVIDSLNQAVLEMAKKDTFKGYGPELGYAFLRESIQSYYAKRGVRLMADEIFVSDGAKSDIGNFLDILDNANKALIPDPVYPAYLDANIMLGRQIDFAKGSIDNGFKPKPDYDYDADIIYLCSPNNPTGAVYSREELNEWVSYANNKKALIIFDAAYEAFIQSEELPRSIFEIDGAKNCAIEVCSLSKTAGFTGTRCGYTIVPHDLQFDGIKLNKLWARRQTTKFNGVPYIIQKGAAAVFSEQGQKEVKESINYYMQNAAIIKEALDSKGVFYVGGENSPYIWLKCPDGFTSWKFFDYLLEKAGVVGTPGSGFGSMGEGYFRLTAFGDRKSTQEAVKNILNVL